MQHHVSCYNLNLTYKFSKIMQNIMRSLISLHQINKLLIAPVIYFLCVIRRISQISQLVNVCFSFVGHVITRPTCLLRRTAGVTTLLVHFSCYQTPQRQNLVSCLLCMIQRFTLFHHYKPIFRTFQPSVSEPIRA